MIQLNKQEAKRIALKLLPHFIIVSLAIFIYFKMNENTKLALTVESQKERAKVYQENAAGYVAQANTLKKEIPKLKQSVVNLEKDNRKKDIQIELLQEKVKSKLANVERYKTNDIALYYKDRYKSKKGITVTQYGVSLNDTVAKSNIKELTLFDGTKEELLLTKDQLAITHKIVGVKDSIIGNVEFQNNKLLLAIGENNKAIDTKDLVITSTEKMFRKEKRKKNFWKFTSTAILGLVGFLIVK
jgi:cell division protein FtsB